MANVDDDFIARMRKLLGIDAEAVERLIDRMDADSLTALNDAVATGNRDAAEKIVGSFDTVEDVNPLFRGMSDEDEKGSEENEQPNLIRAPKDHQFAYGDSVYIMQRDKKGKKKYVGGSVYKPQGPHDVVGVKIDGKPKAMQHHMIYIEEAVLGMIRVPELQRMQQLAGLPTTAADNGVTVEQVPQEGTDSSVQQAMAALDQLEQVLPNVRLADLKAVRQRLTAIQQCMNESAEPRQKKL